MLRRSFLALLGAVSAAPAIARASVPPEPVTPPEPAPSHAYYTVRIPATRLIVPAHVNDSYAVVSHGGMAVQGIIIPHAYAGGWAGDDKRVLNVPEFTFSGLAACKPEDVKVRLFGPLECHQADVQVVALPVAR